MHTTKGKKVIWKGSVLYESKYVTFWTSQVVLMIACQCRRHKRCGFDPWIGKIPWRRAWQPTPVFLPGESPRTEELGGPQSIGLQRIRYNWSDLACMHTYDILKKAKPWRQCGCQGWGRRDECAEHRGFRAFFFIWNAFMCVCVCVCVCACVCVCVC